MAAGDREAVSALVYGRFPELRGVKPSVQRAGKNRVFTFSGSVKAGPSGPTIRQTVRVTVDESGKVVKVVASR